MDTYCVRCRTKTPTKDITKVISKNGKPMLKGICTVCSAKKSTFIKATTGNGIDIHSLIGKLPKPKSGWTAPGYKYMGPYNPLDKQLEYDPKTGEVLKWYTKPKNRVDEISAYHDICYDMGKDKGECDRAMVNSLDSIPYRDMPKWGMVARTIIYNKQKLGMGQKKF